MATLPEVSTYTAGIYQIETTDPVLGGTPTAPANIQAKQLADRTTWLKSKLDSSGFSGISPTISGNLNAVIENGFYYVLSTATNKPGIVEGMCLVMSSPGIGFPDPKIVKQFWIGISVYYRFITVASVTTVGPWIKLQDDAKLVGSVAAFTNSAAPEGWLKANGAAISRTTYADLFAIIGITYGAGNGTTTFNLPDLRGEFIRGFDDGRGIDTGRVLGSAQGEATKSHHHSIQRVAGSGGTKDGYDLGTFVSNGTSGPISTDNVQDFGDPETRPRNIALLYCIKF